MESYQIKNVEEIDTPALIVFREIVEKNIRETLKQIDDVSRLRPHVKTHKSPDVTRLLMKQGVSKFKCATIAEAEMLGECGAKDVLLAYQPAGPKIDRFLNLMEKFPQTSFSCLVDQLVTAAEIAEEAVKREMIVSVFVDINSGMNRTGILPDKTALELVRTIVGIPGLRFEGLHVYDGHIDQKDLMKRKEECEREFSEVEKLKVLLEKDGIAVKVVAGGSPTYPVYAHNHNVEASPGTFVFWDRGYQEKLPEQDLQPAAVILTRVISKTGARRYCLDLGHKSIAAENPLERRVYFPEFPDLQFIGQSEEHLVVQTSENTHWSIGKVLLGIPIHICPTVALYEELKVVEDGSCNDSWPVRARNRKITI